MANICDYLRWRGDLTFSERPFNEVDNLILSALVYLDFTGIVPTEYDGGSVSVAQACRWLVRKAGGDVSPYVRSFAKVDTQLVSLVAESARFGEAKISAYADVVDESRALQFAAMQVELPDAGIYVAFRGTDDTLVGWRENFMLSFEVTEAQREAAHYLGRTLLRVAGSATEVYVGGHSKGGNLAEYAAMACPSHLRQRITCVYSNDGPGMAPEVVARDATADSLVRRIVPAYSVVGMLFARASDRRTVVQSSAAGIEQHDLTTWQVTSEALVEASGLSPDCMMLDDAIARWAEGIALDERERVVGEVFDALGAGGATRVGQIVSSPENVQVVLRALAGTTPRTRETVASFVQSAIGTAAERMFPPRDITIRIPRSRLRR